jgi:hypothetical protein
MFGSSHERELVGAFLDATALWLERRRAAAVRVLCVGVIVPTQTDAVEPGRNKTPAHRRPLP